MNLVVILGGLLAASVTSSFLIAASYSSDIKILTLQKDAIELKATELEVSNAFLKTSIEVRDNTYFQVQEGNTAVERVIEKQQIIIHKYQPTAEEANSVEYKCLDLRPPASLLQQLHAEDNLQGEAGTKASP